jgi:hypothetical protein
MDGENSRRAFRLPRWGCDGLEIRAGHGDWLTADNSKTKVRLGYVLQRLSEPVADQQLDGLEYLLILLN